MGEAAASVSAFAGVVLLAALAPFELTRPILRLPWQSVSNVEAALALACGAWVLALAVTQCRPEWRTPVAASWIVFVAVMALASLAAPSARTNALHMTGRFTAAFAVYLLTINGVSSRPRLQAALWVSLASALVVGVLAILEYLQIAPVLSFLRAFRPGITAVGAQLRAGGPLQYPTIASMYLEIAFAFGLGLLVASVDGGQDRRAAAVFVALVVIAEAITLTFTRAGLIAMGVSLALVIGARRRDRGFDRGAMVATALAVAVAAIFVSSRSTQSLWLRMTSEGQDDWYRAEVDAPGAIALSTNAAAYVPLTVTNTGRLLWDSRDDPPFYLSYHWLLPDGLRVVAYEGTRSEFDGPVAPGASAKVYALVRAPRRAGTYRLVWDVVQEGRLWFSTEPNAPEAAYSQATVSGASFGGPLVTTDLPRITHRPGRFVLWRAALRMAAAHPLLGVGPDNFRLLYGGFAGLVGADPRTHSNNMYLEVLAGGGLAGLGSFAWLLWRARRVFGRLAARVTPIGATPIGLGLAAAGIAIALHGIVDSFLGFAPTYILFALTLGLADAYRV